MNILIDCLPESVKIGGEEYPINYGFRTSILFELLMMDDSKTNTEKVVEGLKLYYPILPRDIDGAVEKILWFYACGKKPKKKKRYGQAKKEPGDGADAADSEDMEGRGEDESEGLKNNVYSFEHDAPYIYAAFRSQYGIDLADIEDTDLHWWKFHAMFLSLNEENQFVKIMRYRGTDITEKMSKEQKAYYRKMQSIYALPKSEAEEEREDAIIEALMSGKSVAGLL